jgi:predicted small secreted protein
MKKMKRIVMITAVLTAAILMFSCDNDTSGSGGGGNSGGGNQGGGGNTSDVDFTSNNTNYSILVRNNTGERLIAFKGQLDANRLIGGIPAHAQGHGLPKKSALFDRTEDFPMILLTEAQYNANKSNLSSQRNIPFTRVYVFYNFNGDNTTLYEIAEGLGGTNTLEIINASNSVNVELRVNGVAGETLCYAPANILNTTIKLQDGNYNIFPVFKRYNAARDVVETVYPKGTGSNYAWFQSYSFGQGTTSATMNLKTLLQSTTFTSGTAWVHVNNQTSSGGIRFVEGTNVHRTASGLENITSGSSRTFQIIMPKVGNKYDDSVVVANWKFGPTGFEVALQTSATDAAIVSSLTIERNKMYTVTVTGSHNDNTLKAWISNITDIAEDELGGAW